MALISLILGLETPNKNCFVQHGERYNISKFQVNRSTNAIFEILDSLGKPEMTSGDLDL